MSDTHTGIKRKCAPQTGLWCLFAWAVLSPVFLVSCAATTPNIIPTKTSVSWPLSSETNRIVWVKNITRAQDLGGGNGFWQRMMVAVSGEETSMIVRPYGVLRTADGKLYLADPGAGLVHCLDSATGDYSAIGGLNGAPFLSPIGLTEDDEGRLYITDSASGMVYLYDPQAVSVKPFLVNPLQRPTGIVYNPVNGLLYVTDTQASQIVVLDRNGLIQQRIGGYGDGVSRFNHPTDIAVDSRGQLYVSDSLNFRITVLTPEGQVLRQFGSPGDAQGFFSRPKGIAVDSSGNIYVSDSLMDAVQVFDQNGSLLSVFGRKGSEPGQFWLPSGIYIDRHDQIYVTDTYNRRIQVFRVVSGGHEEISGEVQELFDKPHPSPSVP